MDGVAQTSPSERSPGWAQRASGERVWAARSRLGELTTLASMQPGFSFTLDATDGAARAGVLVTPHGAVPTPLFMPVGTAATVKGVDVGRVR